jgi:ketosteroid isomerase-like protein
VTGFEWGVLMKSIRGSTALAAVPVATAAPAVAHPEDSSINAVYAGLVRARAAGDVTGMTAAFAPEALLVDARPGPAVSGAELAERLRPQAARLAADGVRIDTRYRIERRAVNGEVAVDAGYMRQTMVRPNGQAQDRYARFLVTLRRGLEGWKIIGDSNMPATEAAWAAAAPMDGLHHDG